MMSKTKELIIAVFFVLCGMFVTYNWAKAQEAKCYPNTEFMKFIDDKGLVTLYNGFKDNKVNEIMMSKDRHIYVVEYNKADDGNALKANQYCIIGVLSDVTFNDTALDYLYKILEKARGQKT
jgi:hypothetical protein